MADAGSTRLAERRAMMQSWSDYLNALRAPRLIQAFQSGAVLPP